MTKDKTSETAKKEEKTTKKSSYKKKTELSFQEYMVKKGADPDVNNGYYRAVRAKNLYVGGKATEDQWDAMFGALR